MQISYHYVIVMNHILTLHIYVITLENEDRFAHAGVSIRSVVRSVMR